VRRGWFLALIAIVLAGLSAQSALAASSGATAWSKDGIVAAPGGPYMTDAFGRRLQLHGVDLVAKCGGGAVDTKAAGSPCVGPARGPRPAFVLTPTAADPGRRFTAADARTLAGMGFTVVRLGIIWEGLEPGPAGVGPNDPKYCTPHAAGTPFPSLGAADPYRAAAVRTYLDRTDRIVKLLAQAGIRVVLDMHQDAWGSVFSTRSGTTPWNGEGAPPWATCTNGKTFTAPTGWEQAYGDPAVTAAIHNFFSNDVSGDLQGQFARVWTAVARYFRGNADVLGYEMYNEPSDFASGDFDRELQCDYGGRAHEPLSCAQSGAQALRDGWIGAIQTADSRHIVFYEPAVTTDFGEPETIGITEPLRFHRVALAFHMYASDAATALAQVASERAKTRTDQPGGPPSIMDEFGASSQTQQTANTVTLAGHEDLSWSYWSGFQLHDPTGDPTEGLLNEQTRRPNAAQGRALAVPYAFATAGQPGRESFNAATRAFTYTYGVVPAIHAPTEVMVPLYTYPLGYRVRVPGARVVSAKRASLLELRSKPGARVVTLTVRPAG
jgi:endoglycosylceramidase